DIRNGLQMECVHCTSCIDACNFVMKKIHRAPNLIKYGNTTNTPFSLTLLFKPRNLLYLFLLLTIGSLLVFNLQKDGSLYFQVLRSKNAPFTMEENIITNQFYIKILNSSREE